MSCLDFGHVLLEVVEKNFCNSPWLLYQIAIHSLEMGNPEVCNLIISGKLILKVNKSRLADLIHFSYCLLLGWKWRDFWMACSSASNKQFNQKFSVGPKSSIDWSLSSPCYSSSSSKCLSKTKFISFSISIFIGGDRFSFLCRIVFKTSPVWKEWLEMRHWIWKTSDIFHRVILLSFWGWYEK